MKKVRLVALILAVITAGALFYFLRPSQDKTETVRYSSVIVAAAEIKENTTITAEMLRAESIPSVNVLSNTYVSAADIIGKTACADIMKNEQIVSARLVTVGTAEGGTLAYAVTPGMRAITIGVNDTTGLKNMVKPGDYVDLISQYQIETLVINPKGEEDVKVIPVSKLLLQELKVLAVDHVMQKTGMDKYVTLTLEVTPGQAVIISYSETNGLLRAVLRSPLDKDEVDFDPVTIDDIVTS